MRQPLQRRTACVLLLALLLLTTAAFLHEARADEPMLAIRLSGDESAVYAVSEIVSLGFNGEESRRMILLP